MENNNRLNMQRKKNRRYPCKKQMMPVFCVLAGVLIGTAGGATVWASENAVQESGLTAEQYQQVLEEITSEIRWAGTEGEQNAATKIAEKFQSYGLEVEQQKFSFTEQAEGKQNSNEAANVIGVKKANKNPNGDILIVSAHHDSKECTVGANDNVSGEAMLLELARVMQDVDTDTEIRFVSFSAEEEGLKGSSYYVNNLSQEEKDHIIGDIQIDMIGHYKSTGSQVMTAFGNEELLGQMLMEAAGQDSTWQSGHAADSDHASFSFEGIPAVLVEQNAELGEVENHKFTDNNKIIDADKAVETGKVIERVLQTIASEETGSLLDQAKETTATETEVPVTDETPILIGASKTDVDVKFGASGTLEKEDENEAGYQQAHYLIQTKWFDWDPLTTDFVFRENDEGLEPTLSQVFIRTGALGLSDGELGEKLTETVGEPEVFDDGESLWGSSSMKENPSLRQYMIEEYDGEQVIEVISFIHANVGEDINSYEFGKSPTEYADLADRADLALMETIHKIIPSDDPYVKNIISWTDGYSYVLGSCSADEIQKSDSFSIRMDKNDFFDVDGNLKNEGKFLATGVHEYAHALTLNADQLNAPSEMEDTADYNDISLYKEDSYMKAFYDQFYADGKQREFYENPEDYVSDYAGLSSIFEDIAESFMQFVLSDRQDGDSLAAAKINFFYDYPEMTAKRDYIRQNFGYE